MDKNSKLRSVSNAQIAKQNTFKTFGLKKSYLDVESTSLDAKMQVKSPKDKLKYGINILYYTHTHI